MSVTSTDPLVLTGSVAITKEDNPDAAAASINTVLPPLAVKVMFVPASNFTVSVVPSDPTSFISASDTFCTTDKS